MTDVLVGGDYRRASHVASFLGPASRREQCRESQARRAHLYRRARTLLKGTSLDGWLTRMTMRASMQATRAERLKQTA
jgi:hypothetical protein